jgi:hypothetical protein
MKCGYSKQILALFTEGDLPTPEAAQRVQRHVDECAECQAYCRQLQESQTFIKSGFRTRSQEPVSQATFAGMRHAVMSQIGDAQDSLSWAMRFERFVTLGFRKQRYAVAGFALAAVLSISLVGQIGHSGSEPVGRAVFIGKDTLVRPPDYREWIFVGSSIGLSYSENSGSRGDDLFHNVYINPSAYREYVSTGRFPEGTVMMLELARPETRKEPGLQGSFAKEFVALEASVKDSRRFEGGWGFFKFTDDQGKVKANASPEETGCRSCHQQRAETDHVFTQFYPVLRSARAAQL